MNSNVNGPESQDSVFTPALAQQLYNSNDQFPVCFDLAWQWLGYSRKDNAKRVLLGGDFIQGVDFLISEEPTTTGIQANPLQNILITVECFKMLGMMAKTEKGRQVRLYFIECERRAKELRSQPQPMYPSLPPRTPEMDIALYEKSMELMERLGGLDDRDEIFFKDRIRAANSQLALPGNVRTEIPVSDRLRELGYSIPAKNQNNAWKSAGIACKNAYKAFYGEEHTVRREQFVDGASRMPHSYSPQNYSECLDRALIEWCCGEKGKRYAVRKVG